MHTITCRFQFTDGATAQWSASARGPEDDVSVTATGATERIVCRDRVGITSFRAMAQAAARDAGALVTVTTAGRYDVWAR